MSQMGHRFRQFLSKNPGIEKCYLAGLINRRSLARYLIRNGLAESRQLEAVIAMLRRFDFGKLPRGKKSAFEKVRLSIKDKIMILDFEKDKELLKRLTMLIENTNYDKGDTLKIVVGSSSIKVFVDEEKDMVIKDIVRRFRPLSKLKNVSELSLFFTSKAIDEKGILSTVTRELVLHDIIVTELLTASPELLIYLKEEYVLKAYEVVKGLQSDLKK